MTIKKIIRHPFFLKVICLMLMVNVFSCKRIKTDTQDLINDALSQLQLESENWQIILQDLQQQLVVEGQETISNEVKNLMDGVVANTGAQVRCSGDFVGKRVGKNLQRIKVKHFGGNMPSIKPHICQAIPTSINAKKIQSTQKELELDGFDFVKGQFDVFYEKETGSLVKINQFLNFPSEYRFTVDLGRNFEDLKYSKRIIIKDKNGQELYSISIQPIPKPIKVQTTWQRISRKKVGSDPDGGVEARIKVPNNRSVITGVGLREKDDNLVTLKIEYGYIDDNNKIVNKQTIGAGKWPKGNTERFNRLDGQFVVVGIATGVSNGAFVGITLYAQELDPKTGQLKGLIKTFTEGQHGGEVEHNFGRANDQLLVTGIGLRVKDDNVVAMELDYGKVNVKKVD